MRPAMARSTLAICLVLAMVLAASAGHSGDRKRSRKVGPAPSAAETAAAEAPRGRVKKHNQAKVTPLDPALLSAEREGRATEIKIVDGAKVAAETASAEALRGRVKKHNQAKVTPLDPALLSAEREGRATEIKIVDGAKVAARETTSLPGTGREPPLQRLLTPASYMGGARGDRHRTVDSVASESYDADDDEWVTASESVALENQWEKLEGNMGVITPEMIDSAIRAAAEEAGVDIEKLQRLVFRASMWGRLEPLADFLVFLYEHGLVIWVDTATAGLGDALFYLAGKVEYLAVHRDEIFFSAPYPSTPEGFEATMEDYEDMHGINDNEPVIILDTVMAGRMNSDEEYMGRIYELVSGDDPTAHLVTLGGWLEGLNVFNLNNYKVIISKLARQLSEMDDAKARELVSEALKELASEEDMTAAERNEIAWDKVYNYILDKPLADAVKWNDFFSLAEPVQIQPYYPSIYPANKELFRKDPSEAIAVNIRPKIPTASQYIKTILPPQACGTDTEVAATLEQHGVFLSMPNLFDLSKAIHRRMSENGYTPDVYFVPTEADLPKSYTMAAITYLMANPEVSPSKVVGNSGLKEKITKSVMADVPLRVLILDDYAGSGASLMDMVSDVLRLARTTAGDAGSSGHKVQVTVAPMVESATASEAFRNVQIRSFRGRSVASISPNDQKIGAWMGGPGFQGGYYIITLPYMSPDNNCWAASHDIAPLFVLNNGGVKTSGYFAPTCEAYPALGLLLSDALGVTTSSAAQGNDNKLKAEDALNQLLQDWHTADHPSCAGLVFQYYCKMDKKNMAEGDMDHVVSFKDISRVYASGRWDENQIGPSPPSIECIEESLSAAKTFGVLNYVQGGEEWEVEMTPGLMPRICELVVGDPYLGSAPYVRDSVGKTGLYGFSSPAFDAESSIL